MKERRKRVGNRGGEEGRNVPVRWVPAECEQNKVLGYRWTVFDRVLGGALPNRGRVGEVLGRRERVRC